MLYTLNLHSALCVYVIYISPPPKKKKLGEKNF